MTDSQRNDYLSDITKRYKKEAELGDLQSKYGKINKKLPKAVELKTEIDELKSEITKINETWKIK